MTRDEKGRFVKGHSDVGAGRKPKSYEEKMLKAISDSCTPDDIEQVFAALLRRAKKGDVNAAKVVLEYTVGKPAQKNELTGKDGGPLKQVTMVEVIKIVEAET